MKKLMIGGAALQKLGSSRGTSDVNYLINDINSDEVFKYDHENNIVYTNANAHGFFKAIWDYEHKVDKVAEIASPQVLLELKCFAYVQHVLNDQFQKVDDSEYDIKFLVRNFQLRRVQIVQDYITDNQLKEVVGIIKGVRM